MSALTEAELDRVGLTRLTHFTPARNLFQILRDGEIRSSKDLADNARDHFSPTDLERFDRHPHMLCCSLEYPNGYYLAQARAKPTLRNYPDWVCLLLGRSLLLRPGTLFSPCNAAKGQGVYLQPDREGFLRCYESPSPVGAWSRGTNHLHGAATDVQAEALVPAPVGLEHLQAIVVPSEASAAEEVGRLELLGLSPDEYEWRVSKILFNRDALSSRIRFGGAIDEVLWTRSLS